MTRFKCALAASLLLALAAPPASAQPRDEDWTRCESGDAEIAIAGCSAVIATDGVRPRLLAQAFYARGNALVARGRHEQAIEDYERVLRINAGHLGAFGRSCRSRAIVGQLEAALKDCEAALQLRPDSASALDSRGFVHLKAGRPDAAIADYDAALRLEANLPYALYGRGIARQRQGDAAGGAADIAAAKAIKADIAEEMARSGVR